MSSHFILNIDLGHAEFEGDDLIYPLRRAVLKACMNLENGADKGWYPLEGKIIGVNGHTVGHWEMKEEKEGNGLLKAAEDARELLETIQRDGFNPGESPFEENPKTNPWSEIEALETAINKAKKRQE